LLWADAFSEESENASVEPIGFRELAALRALAFGTRAYRRASGFVEPLSDMRSAVWKA
jgi:hypothetical protein